MARAGFQAPGPLGKPVDAMSGAVALVGFDSAWADNPRAPGAICAILAEDGRFTGFEPPRLSGFAAAGALVAALHRPERPTLVAIDQPVIVPNAAGSRPVDRAVASVISWAGGGVQPANRGRTGMFDDGAPIWRFLDGIGADLDPRRARSAPAGVHAMEVFPALALLSLEDGFCGRKRAPRYNPARRATFRRDDWTRVIDAAAMEADRLGCRPAVNWLREARGQTCDAAIPRKADQDRLDALLCLLVAIRWRLDRPDRSAMVGDIAGGYIVTPVSDAVWHKLVPAAQRASVTLERSMAGGVEASTAEVAVDRAEPKG